MMRCYYSMATFINIHADNNSRMEMSSKNLLIVEDSKPIAVVIERLAVSLGYKTTIASSFAVVKKLLSQQHKYFAATVDYGLPDAPDGQVVPYIIENGIPAIIMTGRMDDATRKKLLNFPIVDYVTKENAQAYHYLMRVLHGQLTNHTIGVLVVDNSTAERNHIAQLLKRRNFKVYSVDNGTQALQVLEKQTDIKIVITEQEMTGMDGIELVHKIRKMHAKNEMIIIGVSGSSRSFQSARFIKNGADDFLRKPFCPEEFYCRVIQSIEKLKYIEDIKSAADNDYLTSLANRRRFIELVAEQLKDPTKTDLVKVLAIVHIDNFKNINDEHRHQAGDEVLVSFSTLFAKHFSANAQVARLSGAEFSVFAIGEDAGEIEDKLKKMQAQASKNVVKHESKNINYTVSIGGVVIDGDSDFHASLATAAESLKQANAKGKSQLVVEGFIDLG
nr:sensor histidine kinase RcsC [uncultured bacterium]